MAWVLNNQTIPYPEGDKNWNEFTVYAARFYNDSSIADKAQSLFKDHIKAVQTRVNTVNGKKYNEDPVIMCRFQKRVTNIQTNDVFYYSMAACQRASRGT